MSNLLSYFGLVDAKIRASDKDLPHAGQAHKSHAYAIRKRQAEIPIQISGRLDVSIGTQCVLNGRTFKSGYVGFSDFSEQ